jgi:hypothetical protein
MQMEIELALVLALIVLSAHSLGHTISCGCCLVLRFYLQAQHVMLRSFLSVPMATGFYPGGLLLTSHLAIAGIMVSALLCKLRSSAA